jgi:NAD+ synthase (glutamine-hydrolysing)
MPEMLPPDVALPSRPLRIALAQMNPRVGDLDGNAARIVSLIEQAKAAGAHLVAFPELAVTGYPPEDLVLKPGFLRENMRAVEAIAAKTTGIIAVVGFVNVREDTYNAAAVIAEGQVRGLHHKFFLPNYGVFDEARYFQTGRELTTYDLDGVTLGVTICEDIWHPGGPAYHLATIGDAQLLVNLNASPFHAGKWRFREKMLATRANDYACLLAWVNQVGGQDELVFDGHSMIFDSEAQLVARGPSFEEALLLADLDPVSVFHTRLMDPRRRTEKLALRDSGVTVQRVTLPAITPTKGEATVTKVLQPDPAESHHHIITSSHHHPPPERLEEIYRALVLGTRDYVEKNGFQGALIGISGGIDSALTACIAVDALGPERVTLVSMPSLFSSAETQSDAHTIAQNLGVRFHEVPIREIQQVYDKALKDVFAGRPRDIAEENLQARARGNILMALSNKFGWIVLTTGNKSEMACGYATLYGDMAGGFAVVKDVPKTLLYELSEWRNQNGQPIPPSIIDRPPTAELRPDQKDVDSLPPYEVLDPILHAYVEEDRNLEEIVRLGFDEETVRRVILMVDRNEYKRRQAPPGVKITPKAFGKDRRLPITNRYHDF